jgi:hypothetical protein
VQLGQIMVVAVVALEEDRVLQLLLDYMAVAVAV